MIFGQILALGWLLSGFPHLQAFPERWPENYLVGARGSKMTLTCPLMADNVHWNPTTNPKTSRTAGKTLNLTMSNAKRAGVYTCADDHHRKSTVHVLIQGQSSLGLGCFAESLLTKSLRCFIDQEFNFPVLVRGTTFRLDIPENPAWRLSSWQRGPLNFTVPTSSVFCPYEESTEPFNVRVEVMTGREYWTEDLPISMPEIVVPSAPENLKVNGDNITWTYPSSWPHSSFFPLLFEVAFTKRDNDKKKQILEEMSFSKKDIREFKVRCRDLYNLSSTWSAWSQTFQL